MVTLNVGDWVRFSAELICRLRMPGSLGPVEQRAEGQVIELRPGCRLARVKWYRPPAFAGREQWVACCHLWADGKGVRNECPRCAAGKCGGTAAR